MHLYMPLSVERAFDEGRLTEVLPQRSASDYLPRLLGSAAGRRLLAWQPVLLGAYHDYALPLVMAVSYTHLTLPTIYSV